MALNRTIWIYWHQGEANAPELVKRCIASWRTRNPGWQVNVVDALSVAQYCEVGKAVNLGRADIPVQMIADLVRLHLLNRHGGVWADATLYCATPLDDWIEDASKSGFFAFARPGRDRMLSVWFLASTPGNALISGWCQRFTEVFSHRLYPRQGTLLGRLAYKVLRHPLGFNDHVPQLWFHPLVHRLTGIHPYFSLAYKFAAAVQADETAAKIWRDVPVISADPPHRIKRASKNAIVDDELRTFIERQTCPVHKLRWKADLQSPYWVSIINILENLPNKPVD
jgi:hypothetical protein